MEKTSCVEVALGAEAAEYIKGILRNGKTLAKCLLERPDLEQGKIVTFLPPSVSAEAAREFNWGGKFPTPPESEWMRGADCVIVPIPGNYDYLDGRIKTFLRGGSGRFCIMEDFCSQPGDLCLADSRTPIATFGQDVYVFLPSGDFEQNTIEQAMGEANTNIAVEIGALTSLPDTTNFPFHGERDLSLDELRILAQRAETLFIGAYDGEGYLIWERPSANQGNRRATTNLWQTASTKKKSLGKRTTRG